MGGKKTSFCLNKLHLLWEYDKVISVVAATSTSGSLCHLTQQICEPFTATQLEVCASDNPETRPIKNVL